MRTDIAALSELVNLPYVPDSVMWEVGRLGPDAGDERLPAPSDSYLVLVLNYSPEVIAQIQVAATPRQNPQYVAPDFLESWYSKSVVVSFDTDEKTGYLLLNLPHYDVAQFAKSPWLQGFLFFPDSETVFVYLLAL